eukprot:m.357648 g.357648  ORF g.357648 m.357648 type:complete len:225 (+) comp17891_c0_seq1:156-830(+)
MATMEVTEDVIDASTLAQGAMDTKGADVDGPMFEPVKVSELQGGIQVRRVDVPSHRYTPLKKDWVKIYTPIVEQLKLQMRMNVVRRRVEIRTCEETESESALQKAADFVKAYMLGFDVQDAIALLRLDELYLDSFEVTDVKPLTGEHLSRAIGRLAGKAGKTKFTIENVTKTRIVLADSKVHIMGAYQNMRLAKAAICKLIMGSPPSKVYGWLTSAGHRISERF